MQTAQTQITDQVPEELTWKKVLQGERQEQYFNDILKFVEQQRTSGKIIYPKNAEVFNALQLTPFEKVKVVIIGQDPYHGPNQAHGLCFSVRRGVPKPPSLQNICKEMADDIGVAEPQHGCLENWAAQGVLLLNAVLTVEAHKAHSHAHIGWVRFTDKVISVLNDRKQGLIFLLWGSQAQKKSEMIDHSRHQVLSAPHPSPLSAYRGFFGCKHFSKTNELLQKQGLAPVDWSI